MPSIGTNLRGSPPASAPAASANWAPTAPIRLGLRARSCNSVCPHSAGPSVGLYPRIPRPRAGTGRLASLAKTCTAHLTPFWGAQTPSRPAGTFGSSGGPHRAPLDDRGQPAAGEKWNAAMSDPTLAVPVLNRLLQASHRIALKSPSMRRRQPDPVPTPRQTGVTPRRHGRATPTSPQRKLPAQPKAHASALCSGPRRWS